MPALDIAVGQYGRALQHITQFAHVARPVVCEQCVQRVVQQPRDPTAHRSCAIGKELFRQRPNIADAVAQRRQQDVKNLEAVQKILAKGAAFHRVGDVAVARCDDTDVLLSYVGKPEALPIRNRNFSIRSPDAPRFNTRSRRLIVRLLIGGIPFVT
jgi:hypothetical protein